MPDTMHINDILLSLYDVRQSADPSRKAGVLERSRPLLQSIKARPFGIHFNLMKPKVVLCWSRTARIASNSRISCLIRVNERNGRNSSWALITNPTKFDAFYLPRRLNLKLVARSATIFDVAVSECLQDLTSARLKSVRPVKVDHRSKSVRLLPV